MRSTTLTATVGLGLILAYFQHGREHDARFMNTQYSPVDFSITEVADAPSNRRIWLARYGDQKSAYFEIHVEPGSGAPNATAVVGAFKAHRPSGDWITLLRALISAHGDQDVAGAIPRYDSLPFSGEVLGSKMSRADSGEIAGYFRITPAGSWCVSQLVIEPVGLHAYRGPIKPKALQILLAINPSAGKGSLIPIDSMYAPLVFSYFAGMFRAANE